MIKTDIAGNTRVDTDDSSIVINPKELQSRSYTAKRYPSSSSKSKFNLVTVRKLTTKSVAEVNAELKSSFTQLEAAALRTGQPSPYPLPPADVSSVANAYGVYIDEDLDGNDNAVYTFASEVSKINVYLAKTGPGQQDWVVHLAHGLDKKNNPDGTSISHWRIVTIESSDAGKVFHILEDSALPECYSANYDIDSLNYIGGGTWTAMAVQRDDRIPIFAKASANNDRYIKVGPIKARLGSTEALSLVAYSMTPTYVFTWNRGVLKLSKRSRDASQKADISAVLSDGLIKFTREHRYNLNIPYRLENKTGTNNINKVEHNEFSYGKATYVGNTNCPETGSQYQTPDFNTDAARLSIERINMSTNVVRPRTLDYSLGSSKVSASAICYCPVLCASHDMSVFIRHNLGEASGNIEHGYEIKASAGSRGFDYGEYYKYWWGYGKVVDTYPIGDTYRYRRLKNPGFAADGTRNPDRVKIGSMFDLGELKIDTVPNRIITTWDSLNNPQTGFFGIEEGTLSFMVMYNNPPILGHQGVYYYHINPPAVGVGSNLSEVTDEYGVADEQKNGLNTIKMIFSQLQGGLGGGGLNSLYIGNVVIAGSDKESRVVRQPTETQKMALVEYAETFPAGYFETELYDIKLNDSNTGTMTAYNRTGEVISSYDF